MTRTLTRYSGWLPPNRSATKQSLPDPSARPGSPPSGWPSARASSAGLIAPQLIVSSVVASRTTNLSFTLRPVNLPVSTNSAPSFVSRPSPSRTACSTSGAVVNSRKSRRSSRCPAPQDLSSNPFAHCLKTPFFDVKGSGGQCVSPATSYVCVRGAYRHELGGRSKRGDRS